MLNLYRALTYISTPLLNGLLHARVKRGKEDEARLYERKGQPSLNRPNGKLIWFHAASVGEAQSALILINKLLDHTPHTHIIVTTGTRSSAQIMAERLPNRAIHQYYPLDHPTWCENFLDHWKPNYALWMESEFWPNMLRAVKSRNIPAILLNARLSEKSYRHWRRFPKSMRSLLSTFSLILTQSQKDTKSFKNFGHKHVQTTDNLKYAANPLPVNESDLNNFQTAIANRPCWTYASTHDGEEQLAARMHKALKADFPNLITIIVPRHPERRDQIGNALSEYDLNVTFRGSDKMLPTSDTDIYIADTLGELGLFYKAAPIAIIGRSFSNDGGGGHNPIEAAQANCAILTGPNHQFQAAFFEALTDAQAAKIVINEDDFKTTLHDLLSHPDKTQTLANNAHSFAQSKMQVIDDVFHCIITRFSL